MKVNEIFYSLQGEGCFAGTPAVFVRLSGCNLRCPFCDTEHEDGREMTAEEIVGEAEAFPARHVVITGGEPALQLTDRLVGLFHGAGFHIQVETNGTLPLPPGIDWVTCSPKSLPLALERADELKVVYTGNEVEIEAYEAALPARELRLQPCDTGDVSRNAALLSGAIAYVKSHPHWRLSLQTHKLVGIK